MIRNITIQACLNGFIVSVGCQTLAFTSVDELTVKLAGYLREPEKAEKEFLKEAINRRHTLGEQVQVPPQPAPATPEVVNVLTGRRIGADTDGRIRFAPDAPTCEPQPATQGASGSSF